MNIRKHVQSSERDCSEQHTVDEDSYCPNIHFPAVLGILEDLWSHIVGSATKSVSIINPFVREPKVTDFGFDSVIDFFSEDILRFDVPMDDVVRMHIS